MSIDRSQSSRAADPAQRREPVQQKPLEKLEPPSAERIDRFRAVMDQVKGDEHGQPGQPQVKPDNGQAQLTVSEEHAAAGEAARDNVLSDAVEEKARQRADDLGLSATSLPPADASALFQAQMALRDGGAAPANAPPPAANPQAFVDLIERHVRQMAVGDGVSRDGDGQVLLRMADATLPGTDLLLTRNADGWTLRADVRSRESFDAIREAGPELARRFAERNLGTLSIDPHYHA